MISGGIVQGTVQEAQYFSVYEYVTKSADWHKICYIINRPVSPAEPAIIMEKLVSCDPHRWNRGEYLDGKDESLFNLTIYWRMLWECPESGNS